MERNEHEPAQDSKKGLNPWWFITIFIVIAVIVIGGSLFYSRNSRQTLEEQNKYNGFDFAQSAEGYWITEAVVNGQPYIIPFYHHPRETENVSYTEGLAEAIIDNPARPELVYVSLPPDSGSRTVIAGVELSRLFGSRYGLLNMQVKSALSRPDETTAAETPIITCDDAVDGILVLLFEQSDENAIAHAGNCILFRYTTSEESIRVADRFGFELLKIM